MWFSVQELALPLEQYFLQHVLRLTRQFQGFWRRRSCIRSSSKSMLLAVFPSMSSSNGSLSLVTELRSTGADDGGRNNLQGLWSVAVGTLVSLSHLLSTQDLHVLSAVVVDYRGHRVFAQSLIPGLLQREDDAAIMYGSLDCGKSFTDSDRTGTLVSVCEPFPSMVCT